MASYMFRIPMTFRYKQLRLGLIVNNNNGYSMLEYCSERKNEPGYKIQSTVELPEWV